jgi:hypothetical protein
MDQNSRERIPYNVETLISFTYFNCPKSFYNVNDTNNGIDLNGNEYIITPGNYNAYTILDELNSFNVTFSFTYNRITAKITIVKTGTPGWYLDGTILPLLGFSGGSQVTAGVDLTSTYVVDFNGINNIILDMPNISVNNQQSFTGDQKNIVAVIPVDNSNYINYNCPQATRYSFQNVDLSGILLKITDVHGNFIDFQNHNWSLILNVEYRYRPSSSTTHVNLEQFYKLVSEKKLNIPINKRKVR